MIGWPSIRNRVAVNRADMVAGVVGLIIGTVAGFSLILWGNRLNPIVIYDAHERDGVVSRGGHLDIVFDIDRSRNCPSQTSRWIWTWVELDGLRVRQYFPLANSNAEVTAAGDNQRFILSLQLPACLWPGDWYYISKTIEHCSSFPPFYGTKIIETPEIRVHIVDDP